MTEHELREALRRAYHFGQTYWQQADSESYAQNKRADETAAKFAQHVDGIVRQFIEQSASQGGAEPDSCSSGSLEAGTPSAVHRVSAPACAPSAEGSARVTEFNVGRWCLSEDECIAAGIDFSAYERGVNDAAKAFGRNASAASGASDFFERVASTKEGAVAFLKGAGILDEHEELAEPYRASDGGQQK